MKNDLKYLWYYLGSTCSKGEKKSLEIHKAKKHTYFSSEHKHANSR